MCQAQCPITIYIKPGLPYNPIPLTHFPHSNASPPLNPSLPTHTLTEPLLNPIANLSPNGFNPNLWPKTKKPSYPIYETLAHSLTPTSLTHMPLPEPQSHQPCLPPHLPSHQTLACPILKPTIAPFNHSPCHSQPPNGHALVR